MSIVRRPAWWTTVHTIALISFCAKLYFYIPVETLYFQSRGLSFLQITSLWGIIVGAQFAAEAPTGLLADRLGRRRSVSIGLGLQLLGEILFLNATSYEIFVVTAAIAGVGFAFLSGCVEALVYDSLPAGDRPAAMQRAMGVIGAAERAGNVVAFAAGALLVAELTPDRFRLAIILTAAAVAVAWLLSFTLREPVSRPATGETAGALALLGDGVRLLRTNRRLQRLLLLLLATHPLVNYLLALYQPTFRLAGVPGVWYGLVLAGASILAALGEKEAYRIERTLGVRHGLLLVTLAPGLLYLLTPLALQPALAVPLFGAQYAAAAVNRPLFSAYLNGHIDARNRATVLSLVSMATSLYVALVGLLIGAVADRSLLAAYIVMGSIIAAGAVLLRVDERTARATPAGAPAE